MKALHLAEGIAASMWPSLIFALVLCGITVVMIWWQARRGAGRVPARSRRLRAFPDRVKKITLRRAAARLRPGLFRRGRLPAS
jgi:hypothetical protein